MEFSPQQLSALEATAEWLKGDTEEKPFFLINGYAGTGKTTITKHLIEGLEGEVVCGAYTGKAALVMQRAGLPNAQTIHSMLYIFKPPNREEYTELKEELEKLERSGADKTEIKNLKLRIREVQQPSFILNEDSRARKAKLIVLDECSMIDDEMAQDLLSFGTPILVLGDPGQLPPLNGEGFFTRHKPDIMLTEIHRQAADNPIIKLATLAREGRRINPGLYGDSKIVNKRSIPIREVVEAEQVLCGKNATRRGMNQRFRELKGFTSLYPEQGEKLICLKNDRQKGIFNGQIFTVTSTPELYADHLLMRVTPEGGGADAEIEVKAHSSHFEEYRDPEAVKSKSWWDFIDTQQFDFGYSITVHKAQGSQFASVMLMDDKFGLWDRANKYALRHQWLYTAITRAAERITIGV